MLGDLDDDGISEDETDTLDVIDDLLGFSDKEEGDSMELANDSTDDEGISIVELGEIVEDKGELNGDLLGLSSELEGGKVDAGMQCY